MFLIQRNELTDVARFNRIVILMGFIIILFFSYFINPFETSVFACGFKEHTGYSCLSCGLTRSFHATSHLHLLKGFEYHALGPVTYFLIMLITLKYSIELITKSIWKVYRRSL